MNILRRHRKSKKKFKLKTLILLIFSLIMTTFAWFAYSKVLKPTLNIHVASWNMKYYVGTGENRQELTNPIGIEIPVLYPAMDEQTVTIYIENNGEKLVDIEHQVESLTIAGIPFELVQEGGTSTTENYIILTPFVYEGDIVKGTITNDITKLPFTIEIEHSAQVAADGEGYLNVTVNWVGDNNDFDSKWGYIVSDYLIDNPTATSAMSIQLSIDSYQADPNGETITETSLPATSETTPYLPTGFSRKPGTSLESGLVIEDNSGNQYVWVEVPRNETVYATAGLNITEFTGDEYTRIENDLKTYSASYNTRDDICTTYNAMGIPEVDYPAIKQNVLKSIYENGGFYVGRYETGIEGSYRTYNSTPSQTPVIKSNAYPYNYVTCSQAQSLASGMASGEYTSSLMFGFQWDLIMKYLETKGTATDSITTDSSAWGNYSNSIYEITHPNAKYLLSSSSTWIESPYSKIETESMLITTGGNSSILSKQNIYDLSGNLAEWTWNLITSDGKIIGGNGGDYTVEGTTSATNRASYTATSGFKNVGFRVVIY